MPEGNYLFLRPWCARIFRVATQMAIVVSIAGLFGYASMPQSPVASRPYWDSPIADAARQEDLSVFIREVQALRSIDQSDAEGATPLLFVCGNGRPAAVEYLLANGANPNVCHADYGTPLLRAIIAGNYEVAMVLLRYGADAAEPNLHGDTPLEAALRNDQPELAKAIVKQQSECAASAT